MLGLGKDSFVNILGIDPGSALTGLGLVCRNGSEVKLVAGHCLRAPTNVPFEQRLFYLHESLHTFLRNHRVDEVAIEAPFYGANVKTLMQMCQARGSLLTAVARHEIPVSEYVPREIKKAVVGNGNASKEQVAFMVKQTLSVGQVDDAWPLDVTDAIATALCRAFRAGSLGEQVTPASGKTLEDRLVAAGAPPEVARRVGSRSR